MVRSSELRMGQHLIRNSLICARKENSEEARDAHCREASLHEQSAMWSCVLNICYTVVPSVGCR